MGEAPTTKALLEFLHWRYFPCLAWPELTLNPRKCFFVTKKTDILGHEFSVTGMKPSASKPEFLLTYPVSTCEAESMDFMYMLPVLKAHMLEWNLCYFELSCNMFGDHIPG